MGSSRGFCGIVQVQARTKPTTKVRRYHGICRTPRYAFLAIPARCCPLGSRHWHRAVIGAVVSEHSISLH